MEELERILKNDYTTFSGIALERWFSQRMMESHHYKRNWWLSKEVSESSSTTSGRRAQVDECEIDIVDVTINDEVKAIEVKRNAARLSPTRVDEKIAVMQRHVFKGRIINSLCLLMDDMAGGC